MKNNKINLLDCTLRDGGYYNNWFFTKELINEYLKQKHVTTNMLGKKRMRDRECAHL